MDKIFVTKIERFTSLTVVLTIIVIILFSLFPLIYETIPSDSEDFDLLATDSVIRYAEAHPDEITDMYVVYNFQTINMRHTDGIEGLAEKANLINICMWVVLVFSLLNMICLILMTSDKLPSILLMILSSVGTVITSFFVVFLQWSFITSVGNLDRIFLASFVYNDSALKYLHFTIIFAGVIFCMSSGIIWTILGRILELKEIARQEEEITDLPVIRRIQSTPTFKKDIQPSSKNLIALKEELYQKKLHGVKKEKEYHEFNKQETRDFELSKKEELKLDQDVLKPISRADNAEIVIDKPIFSKPSNESNVFEVVNTENDSSEGSKGRKNFDDALSSAINKRKLKEIKDKESK